MNYSDAREFWATIINIAGGGDNFDYERNRLMENFIRFCGWRPECSLACFSCNIRDWNFTRIKKPSDLPNVFYTTDQYSPYKS